MPRYLLPALAAALLAAPARAADTPDPLRLMPKEAGLVIKVEQPRPFVEGIARLDVYKNALQFPQAREILDSTRARRFFQLVAYLEKETGSPWPELIDKLAGGGIAFGIAVGEDPAPALLVVQGTDEAAVAKAYHLFASSIEDEAGREGTKQAFRKGTAEGIDTLHVGKDFHAARAGTAVFLANREIALRLGLKLAAGKRAAGSVADNPSVTAARKLVGGDPVAWGWFDLAKVKGGKATKDFFESTRKDLFQTIAAGSSIDAVRRSDVVAAGLFRTADGFTLSVRLPAKRADLDKAMGLHVPPADRPGSLPLLEPKGVVLSLSYYLDVGYLWKERKTLVNEQIRTQLEKADKDISKVLPGTTFGQLLEQSGPYQRIVVAHTGEKLYDRPAGQPIPPFAVVGSMRDPQFGKSMDGVLRGGAFLAGFQTGWAMREETVDGVKVVSYRFPEKGEPKFDDPQGFRFGFAPAFAVVGDALVVGSTPGIVKLLIPELKKESAAQGSAKVWRLKAYAEGGAETMLASPEPTVTQTILAEGVGLAEAEDQVRAFAGWLKTLGTFELSIDHAARAYQFDAEWKYAK